jgi:hypothetical protein
MEKEKGKRNDLDLRCREGSTDPPALGTHTHHTQTHTKEEKEPSQTDTGRHNGGRRFSCLLHSLLAFGFLLVTGFLAAASGLLVFFF